MGSTHGRKVAPTTGRRAIEREYLGVLLDAVPLETWREICRAAAKAARDGDAKARDWLTRFLMGAEPLRLVELVADDLSGHTADDDIDREDWFRTYHRSVNSPKAFLGGVPVQRPQR